MLHRASRIDLVGRYQLEAAIQSAHIARVLTGHSNWAAILELYDALLALSSSPVAALNRVLAIAELQGPHRAILELDQIATDSRLAEYQPYWAARADLLTRVNARRQARHAYDIAIGLERDFSVRRFLTQRRDWLDTDGRID